jgi:DNA modification methylase
VTYYTDDQVTLYHGDALDVARELSDGSADCIVTSPPYYGLRDFGEPGQYGLESSPAGYVEKMRELFAELRRVLADDGTLWLNIGDSYASDSKWGGSTGGKHRTGLHGCSDTGNRGRQSTGLPDKNLMGIPWRVAFALQDDGWILRNAIIWHKPNAMPESVRDRLSGRYEHVFLFSKSRLYWFDLDAIREPATTTRKGALTWDRETDAIPGQKAQHRVGRPWRDLHAAQPNMEPIGERHTAAHPGGKNPGDVWTIPTQPFSGQIRNGRPHPDHHDPDAPAYGKQRITSPDCPQHGSADLQGSNASDDGHEAPLSSRTADTDTRRGQAPLDDCAATPTIGGPSSAPDSSDSQRQLNESSAMPHSKRSRRTGHGPETSQPCKPSAQTSARTAHIEVPHGLFDVATSTDENRSGGRESHASGAGTARSNAHRCTCSWVDDTASTSHFAVMPPALALRCILAGCKPGGTVLDPFSGSGTTGLAAQRTGRRYVGIDLNAEYLELSLNTRLREMPIDFEEPA